MLLTSEFGISLDGKEQKNENKRMNKPLFKTSLCIVGATVIPFLIVWIYLFVSHTQNWDTELSDYVALGISIIVGLFSISALPLKMLSRIILLVLYIPIISALSFAFAMMYVCYKFNNCL